MLCLFCVYRMIRKTTAPSITLCVLPPLPILLLLVVIMLSRLLLLLFLPQQRLPPPTPLLVSIFGRRNGRYSPYYVFISHIIKSFPCTSPRDQGLLRGRSTRPFFFLYSENIGWYFGVLADSSQSSNHRHGCRCAKRPPK